jgi:hypothetical protein
MGDDRDEEPMSYPEKLFRRGLIATALSLSTLVPVVGTASPATTNNCFYVTQWQGWKSPSPDVIYLGVNMHDVYRVDLSAGSSMLSWPNMHLVSIVRGSDSICTAVDLDLKISDDHGFTEPLIAKSLTKLTPDQVAAIPKKFRPN